MVYIFLLAENLSRQNLQKIRTNLTPIQLLKFPDVISNYNSFASDRHSHLAIKKNSKILSESEFEHFLKQNIIVSCLCQNQERQIKKAFKRI